MATPEAFKKDFAAVLRQEYGEEKVTDERISVMWFSLKHLPDSILGKAARQVTARNIYFPGIDKAIAIALEVLKDAAKTIPKSETKKSECACGGSGVRCVDNYAFQCICAAGKLNYPNNPLYTGQTPFIEQRSENDESYITETRSGFSIKDKATGKSFFRMKDNPWKDHGGNYAKDDFGPGRRIAENDK